MQYSESQCRVEYMAIPNENITTAFTFSTKKVVRELGPVRGLTVRSRSIVGSVGAGIQTIFGGNITLFEKLSERSREEALTRLLAQAESMGANAVIGLEYGGMDLGGGIAEVLAYGTAVVVE